MTPLSDQNLNQHYDAPNTSLTQCTEDWSSGFWVSWSRSQEKVHWQNFGGLWSRAMWLLSRLKRWTWINWNISKIVSYVPPWMKTKCAKIFSKGLCRGVMYSQQRLCISSRRAGTHYDLDWHLSDCPPCKKKTSENCHVPLLEWVVSLAKDREWSSYLPGCTAFKFCFTWCELFRNVYAAGHEAWLRFALSEPCCCYFCVRELALFWCEQDKQDCSQVAVLSTSSERSPGRSLQGYCSRSCRGLGFWIWY